MPIILVHPDELPKSYYTAIGEITYKWALIEFLLHDMSSNFLGLDKKTGRVAFFKTNAKEKITVLKTTAHGWIKDQKIAKDAANIAKAAHDLSDERNYVIHGVWGHEATKPKSLRLMYVKEYKQRIMPFAPRTKVSDLRKLLSRIDSLIKEIRQLYVDAALPAP